MSENMNHITQRVEYTFLCHPIHMKYQDEDEINKWSAKEREREREREREGEGGDR